MARIKQTARKLVDGYALKKILTAKTAKKIIINKKNREKSIPVLLIAKKSRKNKSENKHSFLLFKTLF